MKNYTTGAAWALLKSQIGRRYEDCRLDNFLTDDPDQDASRRKAETLQRLSQWAGDIRKNIDRGQNIILHGPVGTGKDHLLVALAYLAAPLVNDIQLVRGCDLFANSRDRFDSQQTEKALLSEYAKPNILILSDPTPPRGVLSEFQATTLYRILDRRYRDLKPTWVSVNASDYADAERKLSGPTADRLRDGALVCHLNWASFRKSQRI